MLRSPVPLLPGGHLIDNLRQVLVESARTTAMLFTLLIAASIFANFLRHCIDRQITT